MKDGEFKLKLEKEYFPYTSNNIIMAARNHEKSESSKKKYVCGIDPISVKVPNHSWMLEEMQKARNEYLNNIEKMKEHYSYPALPNEYFLVEETGMFPFELMKKQIATLEFLADQEDDILLII